MEHMQLKAKNKSPRDLPRVDLFGQLLGFELEMLAQQRKCRIIH